MSITDEQLDEWDSECRELIKRHEIYEKECIYNDQSVEWDISFALQIVQLIQALRAERKEHKARIQDKDEEILMLRQDNKNWNARTNEIRSKWESERSYRRKLEGALKKLSHSVRQQENWKDFDEYEFCLEALAKKPTSLD